MKEISARINDFFDFNTIFKLALQAVLYYRHLSRAPLKEYLACGQYSFLLALGWFKLAFQAARDYRFIPSIPFIEHLDCGLLFLFTSASAVFTLRCTVGKPLGTDERHAGRN